MGVNGVVRSSGGQSRGGIPTFESRIYIPTPPQESSRGRTGGYLRPNCVLMKSLTPDGTKSGFNTECVVPSSSFAVKR
jgi:hypothetical protein